MAVYRSYRVIVQLEGDDARPIEGPATSNREDAERDLRVITEAQQRGGDGVVALSWLSVRERQIAAAFIKELVTSTASAATSGRRYITATDRYMRDDPFRGNR